MGRIATSVRIENSSDREKMIRCDALVDTGASHMILPSAWRERLGGLEVIRHVKLELATQASVDGVVWARSAYSLRVSSLSSAR